MRTLWNHRATTSESVCLYLSCLYVSVLFLSVWLTTQNHSTLVTERSAVPFLPVNPEYSATRNQVTRTAFYSWASEDVFEVCLGGSSLLLLPPCVRCRHFHAGPFLMEAQRRDDIWGAADTGLKIDILWLYERLRLRFGQQTDEWMFSSCVTAADTRRLPPPLCFHWHPCMTFSVFLLEIVLLYSKTTKCAHSGTCFLRADWPGWEFPVLLLIHETWKEMMGGRTRTPSGQELEHWTVDVAVFSSL